MSQKSNAERADAASSKSAFLSSVLFTFELFFLC